MKKYLNRVKQFVKKFKEACFVHLSREENMEAGVLAKAASTGGVVDEYDKVQYIPSIDLLPEIQQVEGEENWMTPILIYLKDGRLSEDKGKATRLRIKLPSGQLFKQLQRLTSRSVTNVNASTTSPCNHRSISTR